LTLFSPKRRATLSKGFSFRNPYKCSPFFFLQMQRDLDGRDLRRVQDVLLLEVISLYPLRSLFQFPVGPVHLPVSCPLAGSEIPLPPVPRVFSEEFLIGKWDGYVPPYRY